MLQVHRQDKGFTLVELMIVVAIIGILAAIAIPQFAAYRIKGFNSSALSDVKNLSTTEAAMFADFQSFAITALNAPMVNPMVYAGGAGGLGAVCTGPPTVGNIHTITWTNPNVAALPRGVNIGVGSGVSVVAHTEAVVLATPTAVSFTMAAKHLNGDTYYAIDSDIASVYQDLDGVSVGTVLIAADSPASLISTNEFNANGPSGNPWTVK